MTCVPLVAGLLWCAGLHAQPETAPSLEGVLRRMGAYVAGYGQQASLIVAVERYTQRAFAAGLTISPRSLVAEFAVVKAPADEGWTGYRDVVEVDGRPIPDRAGRLLKLFAGPSPSADLLRRIDRENARFNVGPISRNINVPTVALYFLHPARQPRFVFKKIGEKDLDGIATWEISFEETARPTIIRRRTGDNVPVDGIVWVMPGNGTVVKTRLRARGFADGTGTETRATQGLEAMVTAMHSPVGRIESLAEIDVTYRRHDDLGLWLPWKMSELYEGPLRGELGRAESIATYSDFKRFTTDVRLRDPK